MILDLFLSVFMPKVIANSRAAHLAAMREYPVTCAVLNPDLMDDDDAPISLHDDMMTSDTYKVTC